jgi:uncharacterized membrane protein
MNFIPVVRACGEITIELGNLNVEPHETCFYDDKNIEISISVTLRTGPDNTKVIANFYIKDHDGWNFIGKDEKYLNEGQTRTFEINYYLDHNLDNGDHEIKVVVTAGNVEIIKFTDLHINECYEERKEFYVEVGSIELYPSNPDKGDIIQVKVPVTLESYHGSKRVYIYAYIDGDKFYTDDRYLYGDETERFSFTLNTRDYSAGSHTIKVTAKVDYKTDSSSRTFTIGKIFGREQNHCLSIDSIKTDKPLQPGETVKALINVMSCGEADEDGIKAKIEAFSKTYYTGFFDIVSGQSKEVFTQISVPEDASGKQTIKVTVWNDETTDTFSKDFVISTGVPFIEIKNEFDAEPCKTEKITFTLINTGQVADTFTLKTTGPVAEWITGVPEAVTLEPDERKTITAYVAVPCDTESGLYEFTITAEGSPTYSATSSISVIKPWSWPMFALPTGFFWLAILSWIPLLLLILFIIFIIFLLIVFSGRYNGRRRPMFDCKKGCGC